MRIYQNFREAIPEIKRDTTEMGIKCHSKSYQDKDISKDTDFEAMELQNYTYTVVNPIFADLEPTQPWADAEWIERLQGIKGNPLNPGAAWTLRKEVWEEFLDKNNRFAYTYSQRLCYLQQVKLVIDRLKVDPDSRQCFISIWDASDIEYLGGLSRVPCSLGYLIQCRKGKLNMTYLERSADLATHFVNDVYLAVKLQEYISKKTQTPMGTFTHWIGSLHLFRKDALGIF